MAAFDRSHGHIVVRVVYDGPSGAGKTENLRQLAHAFSTQRRGELFSPRSTDAATSYFDWMYFNGGIVDGRPLRAQLVTVPGRSVLTRRRWQLLKRADVVVFVCESTPRGLKEAKRWLQLLRAHLGASGPMPPLVVQANQQDHPDAVPPDAVAEALGLGPGTDVVPAVAREGVGVRETVVLAIRAAAALAEREIVAGGLDALHDAGEADGLLSELDGSSELRRVLDDREELPPFPDEDVASGCVWPATTARAALRKVGRALGAGLLSRVSAASGAIVLRAGDLRLETSLDLRTADVASGRAALLDVARSRVRLGALHAPDTSLALATGPDGSSWVWTITPYEPSLQERIDAARAAGDDPSLEGALRLYGRAVAEALVVLVRDGIALDVDPAAFIERAGEPLYVGGRLVTDSAPTAIHEAVAAVTRRGGPHARAAPAIVAALRDKGSLLGRAGAELVRRLDGTGTNAAATHAS